MEYIAVYNFYTYCLRCKDHLSVREVAKHECCQETIFTEEQKVLLMEGINRVGGVFLNNFGFRDNWHPVTITFTGLETVHTETARQTCYTTKHSFKAFGKMMRNKVFIDLNGSNPGVTLVGNLGFATETHNQVIIDHTVDQQSKRRCIYFGICIHLFTRKIYVSHTVFL